MGARFLSSFCIFVSRLKETKGQSQYILPVDISNGHMDKCASVRNLLELSHEKEAKIPFRE